MSVTLSIVGTRDAQLETAVLSSGRITSVTWLADVAALAAPAARQPELLLLDLRRRAEFPPALSVLKRNHPSTHVILLTGSLEPALMLQAMRTGVNECLAEPLDQAEFAAAVDRLLGQRPVSSAGSVFAFVGAKGGVGTTTTAVNVATTLAKLSPAGALFVDLHMAYGDAGIFLGADGRFSILDAIENIHRMDAEFLRSLVVKTKSGPDLLVSPDRPGTRVPDVRQIGPIVELAATQYAYTILDVPRSDMAVLDSLDAVSHLMVVANQELATVRNAGRMATALRHRYPHTKVSTVINRMDRRAEINQEDVEKIVGGTIAHQFPSDYRRALLAMHKGRPLALDNHNQLSASFTALARDLAGVQAEKPADRDRGSGGLKGLFSGRRS